MENRKWSEARKCSDPDDGLAGRYLDNGDCKSRPMSPAGDEAMNIRKGIP